MLRTLLIRDFVIVDEAEIHFDEGFTVFSGETGAGKSILIDALSLTLGARADTGFIRSGAHRTDLTAVFDTPNNMRDWLQEQELDAESELVLRRTIDQQGRSRAYVNGVPVSLGQLRSLTESLIDIHGQHAHQSLLKASHQRDLLDDYGGHKKLATQLQSAWREWQACQGALDAARAHARAQKNEQQQVQWRLSELEDLDLQPNEWQNLTSDHRRLAHGQTLLEGASQALNALDSDETNARHLLYRALSHLHPLLEHDHQLENSANNLESALIATDEAISELNAYLSALELDPNALEQTESRMAAVFSVARKLHVEPEALIPLQEQLQAELAALQKASDLEALAIKLAAAQTEYDRLASMLSEARQHTAHVLAEQVTQAMQGLAMEGAHFHVALTANEASAHGNETIEFQVASHTGTEPRPLARVASGGELARISLALSVIASKAARVPTLVFDEVDTGIGGGVAEVVGRLLRALGQHYQVLCVTHLAQVAACGHHHYAVRKHTDNNATLSCIEALKHDGRVHEIARMLGGLKITETTRRHAAEMLNAAS